MVKFLIGFAAGYLYAKRKTEIQQLIESYTDRTIKMVKIDDANGTAVYSHPKS